MYLLHLWTRIGFPYKTIYATTESVCVLEFQGLYKNSFVDYIYIDRYCCVIVNIVRPYYEHEIDSVVKKFIGCFRRAVA